jgi:hypothetical protein
MAQTEGQSLSQDSESESSIANLISEFYWNSWYHIDKLVNLTIYLSQLV